MMPEPEELELTEGEREGLKLRYDLFKHMTTLGTVTIIIVATLTSNFFSDSPFLVELLGFYIVMALSTLSAVLGMALGILFMEVTLKRYRRVLDVCFVVTMAEFILAIVMFLVFLQRTYDASGSF
jgi:hypothetical protein